MWALPRRGFWGLWGPPSPSERVPPGSKPRLCLHFLLVRLFLPSQLGLEPFHSVGILGFNSIEWILAALGAIFAG